MAAKDGTEVSVSMKNVIFDLADRCLPTGKKLYDTLQEFDIAITRQALMYILKKVV